MSFLVDIACASIVVCAESLFGNSDKAFHGVEAIFGRIVRDWSLCGACVLGTAGGVVGIAGAVFSSPVLIAVSIAAFAAAMFLGIYSMAGSTPEKSLERQIRAFGGKVDHFENAVLGLKGNVDALAQNKEGLEDTLKESKKATLEFEKIFSCKNAEFDKATLALAETVGKLEDLNSAQSNLAKAAQLLTSQIASLVENIDFLKDVSQGLGGQLNDFEKHGESLSEKISTLKSLTEFYQKQKDELQELTAEMSEFEGGMNKDLQHYDHSLQELGGYTTTLHDAGSKFFAGAEKLELLIPQLNQLAKEVDDLGPLPEKVIIPPEMMKLLDPDFGL